MKYLASLITLLLIYSISLGQKTFLRPLDFGLKPAEHGRIDYQHTPSDILVGNYNNDSYPDIARFSGNKLEIFILQGPGYSADPQGVRYFDQPIKSLRHDDFVWDGEDNLIVTFADGTEDTLYQRGGCLDLQGQGTFQRSDLPRRVSEADFEIVWESEPRPYGMDRCAVGDLDNDGINELVTWWKEDYLADSAFILIYKSTGDDEYELFMEEPFFTVEPINALTQLLIADLDQNGQKELIFTLQWCYFWEFSAPGEYTAYRSNYTFYAGVGAIEVTDVDQDGILELSSVSVAPGWQIPCAYQVEEYGFKGTLPYYNYSFYGLTTLYQEWIDSRLAVGDFDNDGAVDIVSGNFAMMSYDPVDIQYFRYNSTNIYNFTQEWLQTGIPLSCATPVIADLDGDGENELFAGGVSPNGGSVFVWEATGFGSGYVAWLDTTSMLAAPTLSISGVVDGNYSVLSICNYFENQNNTFLYLFGLQNSQYSCLWQPPMIDSMAYKSPLLVDIDQDGKMNIIFGVRIYDELTPNKVLDYEQVSVGIGDNPGQTTHVEFQLHPNYPNPFNNTTVIPFEIAVKSNVRLRIYDISGRDVYTHSQDDLLPGNYRIEWDSSNLSSGIYLISLTAGQKRQVRKAVLLK